MNMFAMFSIGLAGCATVAFAVFVTQSAMPLWGLILVGVMLEAVQSSSDDKD